MRQRAGFSFFILSENPFAFQATKSKICYKLDLACFAKAIHLSNSGNIGTGSPFTSTPIKKHFNFQIPPL